jgi:hypothetical protein
VKYKIQFIYTDHETLSYYRLLRKRFMFWFCVLKRVHFYEELTEYIKENKIENVITEVKNI